MAGEKKLMILDCFKNMLFIIHFIVTVFALGVAAEILKVERFALEAISAEG